MNTITLDQDQTDTLCELLDKELHSWFEFYRGDLKSTIELENYTCFQLLKQMNWPLEDELKIIEKAKKAFACKEENSRFFIHYYTQDNGWIEFNTKEARDNALQGLEDGDYELDNLKNYREHAVTRDIISQKGTDCEERFESAEEES